MSRVSDAAERVEEFLRQRKTMSGLDDTVAGANGHELLTSDLSLLVECAQWLLMASSAELHREYCEATVEPITDDDARIISRNPREPEQTVAEWNDSISRVLPELRGNYSPAFVATRLVSPWERRA